MAREKVFTSAAQKQKAYRLRKQNSTTQVAQSFEPDRVQNQWNKRHGFSTVKSAECTQVPGKVFLVQKGNIYALFERLRDVETPRRLDCKDLESAEIGLLELSTGTLRDSDWHSLDHYKEQAKKILTQVLEHPDYTPIFSRRYGFVFAVEEVLSEGFEGYPQQRNVSPQGHKALQSFRRKMLSILGNKRIPDNASQVIQDLMGCLNKISQKQTLSVRTYEMYLFLAVQTLKKSFQSLPAQFPQFAGLSERLYNDGVIFVKNNIGSTKNPGRLRQPKRHPYIPLEQLEKLLDLAFDVSYETYNYIILSLTTGLRPEEVERLAHFRSSYINNDGTLNYKHQHPSDDVTDLPLTSKTETKVSREDLVNPLLSVVGRVILNHYQPQLQPDDFFDKDAAIRTSHRDLSAFYERSLRTTCATMLAFCSQAKTGRADLHEVKNRLAHETLDQAINTYAKHAPTGAMSPEKFFNIRNLIRAENNFDLGKGQNLWDMWLLRNWIQKFKAAFESSGDKVSLSRMWKQVEMESKFFQNLVIEDIDEEATKI